MSREMIKASMLGHGGLLELLQASRVHLKSGVFWVRRV